MIQVGRGKIAKVARDNGVNASMHHDCLPSVEEEEAAATHRRPRLLRILRLDADRLAIACKHADAWVVLSGNQIGTLLGWFIWDHFQRTNAQANKSDVYMIASTVSSKFLKSMAEKEGFQVCLLSLRVLEQIRFSGPRCNTPNALF